MGSGDEFQKDLAELMLATTYPSNPPGELTAESTGRFPPTPTDHSAARTAIAVKLGEAPATSPNTPAINN